MKKDAKVKIEATENKETPAIATKKNLTPKYPKLNFESFYIDMEILNSTTGYARYDARIIDNFYEFITTKGTSTILRMERLGKNIRNYYESYFHDNEPVNFSGSMPFPSEIKETLLGSEYDSISDVFIGFLLNETKSFLYSTIDRTESFWPYSKISKHTFTQEYQNTIIQTAFSCSLSSDNKIETNRYLLLQLILEAVLWREYTGKNNKTYEDLIRDLAESLSIIPKYQVLRYDTLIDEFDNDDFLFEE